MPPRSRPASQPHSLQHTRPSSFYPYQSPYPNPGALIVSRSGPPAATGYIPNMSAYYDSYNHSHRPTSASSYTNLSPVETSDRPPSIPLSKQTATTLMPKPQDNHSPMPIPSYAPPRHSRPLSRGPQLYRPLSNGPQFPTYWPIERQLRTSVPSPVFGPKPKAEKAPARLPKSAPESRQAGPRPKAASRQQYPLSNAGATSQHGSEQISLGGIKRVASEPQQPPSVKRNKKTSVTRPSLQSTPKSQEALVTPAVNGSLQDDDPMSSKSISDKVQPRPVKIIIKKSSETERQEDARDPTAASIARMDDIVHRSSKGPIKSALRKSHPATSHDNTKMLPEPEPPNTHHRPCSQKAHIEDIVSQSQELGASQESRATMTEQHEYGNASTQYEGMASPLDPSLSTSHTSPEQSQPRTDPKIIAEVVRHARSMAERYIASDDIVERKEILDEVNVMVKSRLRPEEADEYNWYDIFSMMEYVTLDMVTNEQIERMLR